MVEKFNFIFFCPLYRDFIQKMAIFEANLKKKLKLIQIFSLFKFVHYNKNLFIDKRVRILCRYLLAFNILQKSY